MNVKIELIERTSYQDTQQQCQQTRKVCSDHAVRFGKPEIPDYFKAVRLAYRYLIQAFRRHNKRTLEFSNPHSPFLAA